MRDISVISDKKTASADVLAIIKEEAKDLAKEIALIDLYKGEQIPEDKVGLLYRIEYRSDEKTLEDAEVDEVHSRVKAALQEKLNISFR